MKMTMNRNISVTCLSGHSYRFEKNKPIHIAPEAMECVMAKGAIPAKGEDMPAEETKVEKPAPVGPARKEAIFEIFQALIATNIRTDFSGTGVPKITAVREKFEFPLDVKEVTSLWKEFKGLGND